MVLRLGGSVRQAPGQASSGTLGASSGAGGAPYDLEPFVDWIPSTYTIAPDVGRGPVTVTTQEPRLNSEAIESVVSDIASCGELLLFARVEWTAAHLPLDAAPFERGACAVSQVTAAIASAASSEAQIDSSSTVATPAPTSAASLAQTYEPSSSSAKDTSPLPSAPLIQSTQSTQSSGVVPSDSKTPSVSSSSVSEQVTMATGSTATHNTSPTSIFKSSTSIMETTSSVNGSQSTTTSSSRQASSSDKGLSSGAQAGIAISVIGVVLITAGLLYFCWRHRRRQKFLSQSHDPPVIDEDYNDSSYRLNRGMDKVAAAGAGAGLQRPPFRTVLSTTSERNIQRKPPPLLTTASSIYNNPYARPISVSSPPAFIPPHLNPQQQQQSEAAYEAQANNTHNWDAPLARLSVVELERAEQTRRPVREHYQWLTPSHSPTLAKSPSSNRRDDNAVSSSSWEFVVQHGPVPLSTRESEYRPLAHLRPAGNLGDASLQPAPRRKESKASLSRVYSVDGRPASSASLRNNKVQGEDRLDHQRSDSAPESGLRYPDVYSVRRPTSFEGPDALIARLKGRTSTPDEAIRDQFNLAQTMASPSVHRDSGVGGQDATVARSQSSEYDDDEDREQNDSRLTNKTEFVPADRIIAFTTAPVPSIPQQYEGAAAAWKSPHEVQPHRPQPPSPSPSSGMTQQASARETSAKYRSSRLWENPHPPTATSPAPISAPYSSCADSSSSDSEDAENAQIGQAKKRHISPFSSSPHHSLSRHGTHGEAASGGVSKPASASPIKMVRPTLSRQTTPQTHPPSSPKKPIRVTGPAGRKKAKPRPALAKINTGTGEKRPPAAGRSREAMMSGTSPALFAAFAKLLSPSHQHHPPTPATRFSTSSIESMETEDHMEQHDDYKNDSEKSSSTLSLRASIGRAHTWLSQGDEGDDD